MHSNIIVFKSSPDCLYSMTEDDIFENMHGVANYVISIDDITEPKDIINYLQEAFCCSGIYINIHVDPENDKRVIAVIQNPNKVKTAAYNQNDLWICTDLFNDSGDFKVMPLDSFIDCLRYLEYSPKTNGKEVVMYVDKLYGYNY